MIEIKYKEQDFKKEIERIKIAIDKALYKTAKQMLDEAYKDIDRQIFFYHLYENRS